MSQDDKRSEAFEAWWDTAGLKQYFALDGKSTARLAWFAALDAPSAGRATNAAPQGPVSVSAGTDGEGAVSPMMTGEPLSPLSPIANPAVAAPTSSDRPREEYPVQMTQEAYEEFLGYRAECLLRKSAPSATSPTNAVELLKRIRQWDMLDATADGPYWKREIDAVLGGEAEGRDA